MRNLTKIIWLIATVILPLCGHAAASDYDGEWIVTLTCGTHNWLENSRAGFTNNTEWKIVNGGARQTSELTVGKEKADILWYFEIGSGQAKLQGSGYRGSVKEEFHLVGKPTAPDHLSLSGDMSASGAPGTSGVTSQSQRFRTARECTVQATMRTPSPNSLAAKMNGAGAIASVAVGSPSLESGSSGLGKGSQDKAVLTSENDKQDAAAKERERLAKVESEKIAQEKLAQETSVKEKERLAQVEAERLAQEKLAQETAAKEKERLAQVEAEKLAREKLAQDAAAKEKERLAQVEAEKLAQEKLAQEAAANEKDRAEQLAAQQREQQRIAQIEAQRLEQERVALAAEREKRIAESEKAKAQSIEVQAIFANRKALVIGNDSYKFVTKLANAREDAKAVAKNLAKVGYQVTLKLDVSEKEMKAALRAFKTQVEPGDEVAFFYAGHGVQIASTNYLLPTDIAGEGEEQIKDEAIALQRVLYDMEEKRAKFTLALIDACRDNPFQKNGRSIGGVGRGLAPTSAATGQMIVFSAGTGQQALDNLGANDKDKNGLFTRVFIKQMMNPGVSVDRIVRNVRAEVVDLAKSVGKEQVPAIYDQVVGDFYFQK